MKKRLSLFLILFLSFNYLPVLQAEDDVITTAQVTTQAVRSGELTKNYEVTGENLIALIEKIVDFSNPNSALVFNRWTGQLFVKHTAEAQGQITKLLSDVRRAANRQVEIEARIMTVKGTDFSQKGLDLVGLDFLGRSGHGSQRFGTDTTFGDSSYNSNINFQDTVDAAGAATGGQLSLAMVSKKFNLSTLFDFLEKKTDANTLSAPRITVFNNQRAHIKISEADFYVKKLTVTSDIAATTVATRMLVDAAHSGTVLDVTPTINRDGTITLELHPQFVTVDLTKTQTINVAATGILPTASQPFVRLPIFNNQSIDTTVTIEDGGVIILGGLVDEREENSLQRVPGLWRIPLLGKLFQNDKKSRTKTHLLIFIRAKAIYNVLSGAL